VHRMQSIVPRPWDSFTGEAGSVLFGAWLLRDLSRWNSYWVTTGWAQHVLGPIGQAPCRSGYSQCNHPEDLFIADVPLLHVAGPAELGPGKWHFDYAAGVIYVGEDPSGKKVELSVT